jgi:hypothetical protein
VAVANFPFCCWEGRLDLELSCQSGCLMMRDGETIQGTVAVKNRTGFAVSGDGDGGGGVVSGDGGGDGGVDYDGGEGGEEGMGTTGRGGRLMIVMLILKVLNVIAHDTPMR